MSNKNAKMIYKIIGEPNVKHDEYIKNSLIFDVAIPNFSPR